MGSASMRVMTGFAGAIALVYAASVFMPWRPTLVAVAQDVMPILIPLVAAVFCFRAARRGPKDAKATWLLLGGGAASWALGDIGFSVFDLLGIDPAGSLTAADVGYLALVPLWAVALLLHPACERRGLELFGSTLDALAIFMAAGAITIAFVLVPTLADAEDAAGAIVALAYPVGDLILVGALVSVWARASRLHFGEMLIGTGVLAFAIGDITFARLVLVDAYDTGHPVDLTWAIAFVLLMFAARSGLRGEARSDLDTTTLPVLTGIGMLAMGTLAGLAILSTERRTTLLAGAVTTGLFVAVRQTTLLLERVRIMRTLDRTVRSLEEAQGARERLLATVSHDLRNPLAAISGFAELLTQPATVSDPHQVTTFAESIKRNAGRLSRLTEDLLTAGQFAAGHLPQLLVTSVELHTTAIQAIEDLGYTDRVRIEGTPVWVAADPERVEQVLGNLIDNALKHTTEPGGVTVLVGPTPEGAVLEVADRGTGIAPERMQDIFDPFVSDHSRKSSAGLGLYVVRNLVSAMGGRVSVTSELGHGSSFRVVLPIEQGQADNVRPLRPGRVA